MNMWLTSNSVIMWWSRKFKNYSHKTETLYKRNEDLKGILYCQIIELKWFLSLFSQVSFIDESQVKFPSLLIFQMDDQGDFVGSVSLRQEYLLVDKKEPAG